MLERSEYPDRVVAAAVRHDVLEDTDAERSELEARFGPEVSGLVGLVSDDPSISCEEEQRDEARERVRRGPPALVIYAADKVQNPELSAPPGWRCGGSGEAPAQASQPYR